METGNAIELKGVTKRFGDVIANDNVNLTVRKGEILSILGENGSGKTTLMNMLSGIYFPDEGEVYVDGKEVHLTPIEYKLLCLLAKNVGKVLTHNFILKEVWGNALPGDTPSLRVFMATLRKKIEPVPSQPKYIQTHIGVGYRMLRISEEMI